MKKCSMKIIYCVSSIQKSYNYNSGSLRGLHDELRKNVEGRHTRAHPAHDPATEEKGRGH